jgi:hypothetical protein
MTLANVNHERSVSDNVKTLQVGFPITVNALQRGLAKGPNYPVP